MLIGTLDDVEFAPDYPELTGKRVLITGVKGAIGVDVVRSIREQNVQIAAGTIGQEPAPRGTDFQYTLTAQGRLTTPGEFGQIVLRTGQPVMVTFAIGVAVLMSLQALAVNVGYAWAAVACGALLLVAGAVACGSAVAAKWLIVGRIAAGEKPLWSSFVWRNEVSDTFVETVAAPWFARAASGTPVMNLWLRALGAKIARGVWCETYWLPEADLVTLGTGSTVNRGCVVQTHLFHDRIMRMDTVVIEEGATLGTHCVALPASRIGAGATVGPASLVMRGDEVPAHTRWQGNPIAPWGVSRKKSRDSKAKKPAGSVKSAEPVA